MTTWRHRQVERGAELLIPRVADALETERSWDREVGRRSREEELSALIAEQTRDDNENICWDAGWSEFEDVLALEYETRFSAKPRRPRFQSGRTILRRKPRHGTFESYARWDCRCDLCVQAAALPEQTPTGRPKGHAARLHAARSRARAAA